MGFLIEQTLQQTTLGKEGMIYRKGQQIVLENEQSGEHIAVKVIMHDSRQGWLAENADGDWLWYRMNNEYWPDHEHWKYIKKVGT